MKKSFKLSSFSSAIAAALVLACAAPAFADNNPMRPPAVSGFAITSSSGTINAQTSATASSGANGSSYSYAGNQTGAYASGAAGISSDHLSLNGRAGGYSYSQAYNVSTGTGNGSASAGGSADAQMSGYGRLSEGAGRVWGSVGIDGFAVSGVRAAPNQNGYSGSSFAGEVAFLGTPVSVDSVQWSEAGAGAGNLTFDGGTPRGQTAAGRQADAGASTYVYGGFENSNGVYVGGWFEPHH